MHRFERLNNCLREIVGENVSGGGTSWEDMEFFQKVKKDETVNWHHSGWLQSELAEDEEIQMMTIIRGRKKPLDKAAGGE